MRTETNVFTSTEVSMLRIDDKIAMFSTLIKVRTLRVECFTALQPFGGGPPSAAGFPSLITTSNLQESEPSRMRTETNVFTSTEVSMLRIDDKNAMF